jgi:hypothetical protein
MALMEYLKQAATSHLSGNVNCSNHSIHVVLVVLVVQILHLRNVGMNEPLTQRPTRLCRPFLHSTTLLQAEHICMSSSSSRVLQQQHVAMMEYIMRRNHLLANMKQDYDGR